MCLSIHLNERRLQGFEPVELSATCFQGQAPQSEDENTPQKRVEKIFDQVIQEAQVVWVRSGTA